MVSSVDHPASSSQPICVEDVWFHIGAAVGRECDGSFQ